jgi:hypothetical protein
VTSASTDCRPASVRRPGWSCRCRRTLCRRHRSPPTAHPYASGEALLDDAIRNPSGELVAEVKDVLIDFRSAHVRHLLVQSAKDPQDRLFLVELVRLQRPEGSPHLVFDGTAEQLAASPSIPKARLDDTDFATLR